MSKKFQKSKAQLEKDLVSIFSSVFLTDDDDDYVARQETAHQKIIFLPTPRPCSMTAFLGTFPLKRISHREKSMHSRTDFLSSHPIITMKEGAINTDMALLLSSEPIDGGIFSSEDITTGLIIGFFLAFLASFLQGQGSQNDIVLWNGKRNSSAADGDSTMSESKTSVVFDGDDWREISRPENYILYNRRSKDDSDNKIVKENNFRSEKAWVLLALLALFVPIFSIEFFFALSRQVLCGGGATALGDHSAPWAEYLCSPV